MARRIDIELTSARPDNTWTWRAAGAREPKGTIDGKILPEAAKVGDVLRAEADFEIDGISILSVTAPKAKRPEEGVLELLGPVRAERPTSPAGRPGPSQVGRRGQRRAQEERRDRHRERPEKPGEPAAAPRGRKPAERAARSEERQPAERAGGHRGPTGGRTPAGAAPRSASPGKGRRLNVVHAHRSAVLDSLPPEQRPVAEQVLRGGIPAVRTAIHLEREKAAAEGRPAPNADALVAMAEELQPRLKAAEWQDRAEAAERAGDAISLRDLRSVVAGADVARDAPSRQLAATLRERLEAKVEGLRAEWLAELTRHLDEGRLVRALRLAARLPDPHARVPTELADRMAADAGAAMSHDAPPQRWVALLDAVAASPVRRSVRPAALPDAADADLRRAAHQQAGRIPALAGLLGLRMPPPPGPRRTPAPAPRPPARVGGEERQPDAS